MAQVYLWEYRVPAETAAAFLERYGPDGAWVRLFRGAEGWIETRLLEDAGVPGRYLTIDRWDSAAAFEAFRRRSRRDYEALDRECEALTTDEKFLGSFTETGPGA